MLTVTSCHSECCVPSGLDFEAAGDSVVRYFCVQLFALRASSRCKHDVGALSWLNVETVERAPTPPPLWQTCKVLRSRALFRETTVCTYTSKHVQKPDHRQ